MAEHTTVHYALSNEPKMNIWLPLSLPSGRGLKNAKRPFSM